MTARLRPREAGAVAIVFVLAVASPARPDPLIVTPSISVAETLTDNVFFDESDKADAITRLRLHLNFAYQTQSSTTNFSAGTSAAYLARNSTTTVDLAEAQHLALSTSYDYSPRLQLTIGDSLGRVGSGVRDLSYIDNPFPTGASSGPTVQQDPAGNNPSNVNILLPSGSAFTNSLNVSSNYALTPIWSLGISLANGTSSYSDPNATDVSQSLTVSVGHQYSATLGLNGGFAYHYFYASSALDSDSYTLFAGPSYEPASLWRISALLGGSLNRTVTTGSLHGTADVHIDVSRALENSVVAAGVSNGYTPSAGVSGTSQTLNTYLIYSRKLTRWLAGSSSFTYSHFNTNSDTFDLFTLRTGLFYPIWKNLTGSLNYAYRRTDGATGRTQSGSGVIDSNVLSLQITWATPFWQFDL